MKIDLDRMKSAEALPPIPDTACAKIRRRVAAVAATHGLRACDSLDAAVDCAPDLYNWASKGHDYAVDRRGLFLIGKPGTGKTIAMYVLAHVFDIEMVRAGEMASTFAAAGEEAFWDKVYDYRGQPLIIDDLGAERDARSYGNASPIAEWLMRRYNSWQLGGAMTCLTSNLTAAELRARYGERILDRIYEMSRVRPVGGASLRRKPAYDKDEGQA